MMLLLLLGWGAFVVVLVCIRNRKRGPTPDIAKGWFVNMEIKFDGELGKPLRYLKSVWFEKLKSQIKEINKLKQRKE